VSDDANRDAPGSARWTDHQVEQVVGRLLQIGVLIAAAVVILGAVPLLLHHGREVVDYRTFRAVSPALQSVAGIVRGAITRDSRSIVQLGLVLLIATPVARVALTLVAFVLQRDRLYVAITTIVLVLLLYGLVWGHT
jgi:uncharacterized membrane protein